MLSFDNEKPGPGIQEVLSLSGKTSSVPCTYTRVSCSYADLIIVHLDKQSSGTIWGVWQTLYPRSKL